LSSRRQINALGRLSWCLKNAKASPRSTKANKTHTRGCAPKQNTAITSSSELDVKNSKDTDDGVGDGGAVGDVVGKADDDVDESDGDCSNMVAARKATRQSVGDREIPPCTINATDEGEEQGVG